MSKLNFFELPAKSPDKIKKFYGKVFGWKFKQWGKEKFWMIKTGEKNSIDGGIYLSEKLKGVVPAFSVPNLEQALKKIKVCGGKVYMIMDEGNHYYIKDPEGTIFSIWEEK